MSTEVSKYKTDTSFSQVTSDEIDLRKLFSVIWQGKWLIIGITTVFAIGSVALALYLPNIYKSEALLAPAAEEQNSGLNVLASQFGGLASLAGMNLGAKGGGTDKTLLAIEVLKSRKFASDFIQRHKILPDLMAAESWSRADGELIYNAEVYDVFSQKWIREVEPPFTPEPSMQEAYKKLSELVSVNKSLDTGLVTITVEHYSPTIAQKWVELLVKDINEYMKERDVIEALRSTRFLEEKINQTNVADIKVILYKLIEEQAKVIMFAEVRDEYIFKTIDPAVEPELKEKPRRALICIFGTFIGAILAIIYI
ncbi:LPS O-antigen length regulator, partial [Shewanella sp. M16]|uniref:Wzz/FepE/Etk N-terminal domain-containing protein n=1 Tax=Shewanella sp. M16 TaxID=2830837 RepID=UPI001BAFE524